MSGKRTLYGSVYIIVTVVTFPLFTHSVDTRRNRVHTKNKIGIKIPTKINTTAPGIVHKHKL